MRHYTTGQWGLAFIWTCSGSVFPKSIVWATPASVASVLINRSLRDFWREEFRQLSEDSLGWNLLGTYTAVLGFILVFRSQLAYARWWEGGTLLQQLRGEWFNAFSNLISFCTSDEDMQPQVEGFQQLLVRLMSLLHGCALQQVSTMEQNEFDIFDLDGLDKQHLIFLKESSDKCEITLQWIQRLVVQHFLIGTIQIPAPILSRVFQELSRGIVNLHNARKITDFPFPFPWSQMVTVMLIIQIIITPVMAGIGIESATIGAWVTFLVVFASFGIHYIAQELENPFGDDPNDLPLREMQVDMNKSMIRLLDPKAQSPPTFAFRSRVSWTNIRKTGADSVLASSEDSSGDGEARHSGCLCSSCGSRLCGFRRRARAKWTTHSRTRRDFDSCTSLPKDFEGTMPSPSMPASASSVAQRGSEEDWHGHSIRSPSVNGAFHDAFSDLGERSYQLSISHRGSDTSMASAEKRTKVIPVLAASLTASPASQGSHVARWKSGVTPVSDPQPHWRNLFREQQADSTAASEPAAASVDGEPRSGPPYATAGASGVRASVSSTPRQSSRQTSSRQEDGSVGQLARTSPRKSAVWDL